MASIPFPRPPYSKSQSQSQSRSQSQSQPSSHAQSQTSSPPPSWSSSSQSPHSQFTQQQQQQQQRSTSFQPYLIPPLPTQANFTRSASHPNSSTSPMRQENNDFLTQHYAAEKPDIASPDKIALDNLNRKLSFSSRKLKISDFELMKTLGTGTFARVWLARLANPKHEDRNRVFALKVLRKVDVIRLKQVEHVRNERNVLAAVAGYPFITTLVTSFADTASLYMLLDYTPGGEIFSYLRRAKRFAFTTVQFYAAEITLILAYLHDHVHVAYRDLKPENILLDANGHLKLVDFGFAKSLPPAPAGGSFGKGGGVGPGGHGRGVTYTLCGTPEYLAPEVIRNQGHGMAVDWWALGILVYEMLIGQPPFWDSNPMRIYEQIVAGHIRFPLSPSPPSSTPTTAVSSSSSTPPPPSSSSSSTATTTSPPFHVNLASRQFILALCRTDPAQRLGHIAGGSASVMAHHFFDGVDWDAIYYKKIPGPIVPRVEWAGDAGNFDDYPDPDLAVESDDALAAAYTEDLRLRYDAAFDDF